MAQPAELRLVTEAAQTAYRTGVLPNYFVPVSRGVISSAVDADTYRDATQVGAFTVRASNLTNGPKFDGDPLITFDVLARNGSNAITQLAISDTQFFWRNARNSTVWEPWQEIGKTAVVSADKAEPLVEGQTLLVPEMGAASTAFETYPAGFLRYWSPNGTGWVKNDLPGLLDGRGIRYNRPFRALTAWSEFTGMRDGEILTRMAMDTIPTHQAGGLAFRASGNAETFTGYTTYVAEVGGQTQFGFGVWSAGSGSSIATVPFEVAAGEPFWVRVAMQDAAAFSLKAWRDSDPEPEGWMITDRRASPHTGGSVGVYHNSTGGVQIAWDVLSINTVGGRA